MPRLLIFFFLIATTYLAQGQKQSFASPDTAKIQFSQLEYIDSLLQFYSPNKEITSSRTTRDEYLFPIQLCARNADSVECVDYIVSCGKLFDLLAKDQHLDTNTFIDIIKDCLLYDKPVFVPELLTKDPQRTGSTIFSRITDEERSKLIYTDDLSNFLNYYFLNCDFKDSIYGILSFDGIYLRGAVVEQLFKWRILVSDNVARGSSNRPCSIQPKNYPSDCDRMENFEKFYYSFFTKPDFQKERISFPLHISNLSDSWTVKKSRWRIVKHEDIVPTYTHKRPDINNHYITQELRSHKAIQRFHSKRLIFHFEYKESKWMLVDIINPTEE